MKYLKLNNGEKIPVLNFGVFEIEPENTKDVVLKALEVGYRSFDNAQIYLNEKEVGQAIKESDVSRDDVFLISKNWVSNAGYEKTLKSFDKTLEAFQTDYLDLFLIHQPFGDYYGSYRALEDLQKEGKLLSIGLSNFYPDRLIDLVMNYVFSIIEKSIVFLSFRISSNLLMQSSTLTIPLLSSTEL